MIIWNLKLKFEPRDVWIGLYWNYNAGPPNELDLYLCLVPFFPLHLNIERHQNYK